MALLTAEQVRVGTIFLSPRLGTMVVTSVGPHTYWTESDDPPLWTAKRFDLERREIEYDSEVGYEKSDLDKMIYIDHMPDFEERYDRLNVLAEELEEAAHDLRMEADRFEEMSYELETGAVTVEQAKEALKSLDHYFEGGDT